MRGTISLGLQGSINTAMGLLFFVILARLITKEEMGVYATILFTSGAFMAAGALGLNVAAARFVPKLLAEGKGREASGVAKRILQVALVAAAAAGLGHYALAPYFSEFLTKSPSNADLFRLMSLVAAAALIASASEGLVMGLQEFGFLSGLRVVGQAVRIAVSTFLILVGYGLVSVIVGLFLSSAISSLAPLVMVRRRLGLGAPPSRLGPLLSFSLPLFAANTLAFLSAWVDAFAVMVYSVAENVGVYNVAITASGALTTIVLGSIQATLLPAMSRAYGKNGVVGIEGALKSSTKYTMLFYCPLGIGLAAASEPAIVVFVGQAYWDASLPFALMLLGTLALALATPVVLALSTLGRTGRVLLVNVFAVAIDLAVSLWAVRAFGILGAALGRSTLFASTLFFALLAARGELRVRMPPELGRILLASTIMILPYEALTRYYSAWVLYPLYGLVSAASYLALVRGFRLLDRDDFEIFRRALPRSSWWVVSWVERFVVGAGMRAALGLRA